MSAFLGPIHFWLYKKIRLVIEREELIFQKAEALCGSTAEELRDQVWQSYGQPLPDVDLSQLIDQNNIHGWLQRQINIAESREAAFIKELLDTCGTTARDVVTETFQEHGQQCGEQAKAKGSYDLGSAPGIYQTLNDFYLNGMPCDQGDAVVQEEPDKLSWESEKCLQEPNWKRVGVDNKAMAEFYLGWLKAFVTAANQEFAFKRLASRLLGDTVDRYEISKK